MVGAPGAGKGTQAALLAERLGMPHVASGDSSAITSGVETPLGKKVKSYHRPGALVPDDLTVQMIADRLTEPDAREGAILDGFPRTRRAGGGTRQDARQARAAASPLRCTSMSTATSSCADCPAAGCARDGLDHVYHETARPPRKRGQMRHRRRGALPARRRQAADDPRALGAAGAADVRSHRLLQGSRRAQHRQRRPPDGRGHGRADARDRAARHRPSRPREQRSDSRGDAASGARRTRRRVEGQLRTKAVSSVVASAA